MEQMIYQKPRAMSFCGFSFPNSASYPHWNEWWIHLYKPSGKNILGIIHFMLFKGSESWPNQNQFPLKLSKVLPNEICNPGQMSVLKWAIQILIFKCFHKGKNIGGFFSYFYIYKLNTGISSTFIKQGKRAAFLTQHFSLRRERSCQIEKR